MAVRVERRDHANPSDSDFVRVCTSADPADDTVTLATIERIVARSNTPLDSERHWRVKTLIHDAPMSPRDAVGLATCYAKRKGIPIVYTD